MLKITLTCTIASIFFLGCTQALLNTRTNFDKPSPVVGPASGRIYDCAANSLYSLCQRANIPISYKMCLELLPFSAEGNSMLEFKTALLALGFQVEAQRLTVDELANIRVPSILLMLSPEYPDAKAQPVTGHYLVLWPLDEESVQILDYPRAPVVLSTNYWIRHLQRIGVTDIPILLCGKEGQSLEEMLLLSEVTAEPSAATKNLEKQTRKKPSKR